ncbi:hypothetical protein EJB05_32001, partial [Eragrostis curvula]
MVNWAIGGFSACPMQTSASEWHLETARHHRDFYGGFKFGMYQKLLDQDDLVVMHDTGMTKAWA